MQAFDKRQSDDYASDPHSSYWSVLAARLSEYAVYVRRDATSHPRALWLRDVVLRTRADDLCREGPNGVSFADAAKIDGPEWARWLLDGVVGAGAEEVCDIAQRAAACAKRALSEAAYARKKAWAKWLEKALERGAGIAHKWASRPNRSVAQLAKVKDGVVHTHPDEVLQIRRQVWEAKWNRPDSDPSRALIVFQQLKQAAERDQMEPITPAMVLDALRSFAGTKGLGLDLWHPKGVMSWPSEAIDDLVGLLNSDRKSTRLNSSHSQQSRMPSSA